MTTDKIIAAAREAGFGNYAYEAQSMFERFYAIAYRAGMERAAEICEALQDIPATEARHCAEDIRIEAHAKNQPESTHDTGNV